MKTTLQLLLVMLALVEGAGAADETVLGEAAFQAAGQPRTLKIITVPGAAKDSLQLSVRVSNAAEPLTLKTAGQYQQASIKKDEPLSISEVRLGDASGVLVTFSIVESQGVVRSVGVLLIPSGTKWTIAHEWEATCGPLGELGFTRQKQTFASKAGTLTRQSRNTQVEGIMYKLDCGCPACASRTTEYLEDETWSWDAGKQALERTAFEKRYIVQPSEGLMSVARKAFGDARMIQKIYKLNPDLKPDGVLKEGQGVVVERVKAEK